MISATASEGQFSVRLRDITFPQSKQVPYNVEDAKHWQEIFEYGPLSAQLSVASIEVPDARFQEAKRLAEGAARRSTGDRKRLLHLDLRPGEMVCLDGQCRIRALLNMGRTEAVVDVFCASIGPTDRDLIKHGYSNRLPVNHGHVYRAWKNARNNDQWICAASSLSRELNQNRKALQACPALSLALDRVVLDIPGMAPFFDFGIIKALKSTRCVYYITNYLLQSIHAFWSQLVENVRRRLRAPEQYKSFWLDKISFQTMNTLGGLSPGMCEQDREKAGEAFGNPRVFQFFSDEVRSAFKEEILRSKTMIPTLKLFLNHKNDLKRWSTWMKRLLGIDGRSRIPVCLREILWNLYDDDRPFADYEIWYSSALKPRVIPHVPLDERREISIRQLWLFIMRQGDFDAQKLPELARMAKTLGFASKSARDEIPCGYLGFHGLPDFGQMIRAAAPITGIELQGQESPCHPPTERIDPGARGPQQRKCRRDLRWGELYEQARPHFFFDRMETANSATGEPGVTMVFVYACIYRAFFGDPLKRASLAAWPIPPQPPGPPSGVSSSTDPPDGDPDEWYACGSDEQSDTSRYLPATAHSNALADRTGNYRGRHSHGESGDIVEFRSEIRSEIRSESPHVGSNSSEFHTPASNRSPCIDIPEIYRTDGMGNDKMSGSQIPPEDPRDSSIFASARSPLFTTSLSPSPGQNAEDSGSWKGKQPHVDSGNAGYTQAEQENTNTGWHDCDSPQRQVPAPISPALSGMRDCNYPILPPEEPSTSERTELPRIDHNTNHPVQTMQEARYQPPSHLPQVNAETGVESHPHNRASEHKSPQITTARTTPHLDRSNPDQRSRRTASSPQAASATSRRNGSGPHVNIDLGQPDCLNAQPSGKQWEEFRDPSRGNACSDGSSETTSLSSRSRETDYLAEPDSHSYEVLPELDWANDRSQRTEIRDRQIGSSCSDDHLEMTSQRLRKSSGHAPTGAATESPPSGTDPRKGGCSISACTSSDNPTSYSHVAATTAEAPRSPLYEGMLPYQGEHHSSGDAREWGGTSADGTPVDRTMIDDMTSVPNGSHTVISAMPPIANSVHAQIPPNADYDVPTDMSQRHEQKHNAVISPLPRGVSKNPTRSTSRLHGMRRKLLRNLQSSAKIIHGWETRLNGEKDGALVTPTLPSYETASNQNASRPNNLPLLDLARQRISERTTGDEDGIPEGNREALSALDPVELGKMLVRESLSSDIRSQQLVPTITKNHTRRHLEPEEHESFYTPGAGHKRRRITPKGQGIHPQRDHGYRQEESYLHWGHTQGRWAEPIRSSVNMKAPEDRITTDSTRAHSPAQATGSMESYDLVTPGPSCSEQESPSSPAPTQASESILPALPTLADGQGPSESRSPQLTPPASEPTEHVDRSLSPTQALNTGREWRPSSDLDTEERGNPLEHSGLLDLIASPREWSLVLFMIKNNEVIQTLGVISSGRNKITLNGTGNLWNSQFKAVHRITGPTEFCPKDKSSGEVLMFQQDIGARPLPPPRSKSLAEKMKVHLLYLIHGAEKQPPSKRWCTVRGQPGDTLRYFTERWDSQHRASVMRWKMIGSDKKLEKDDGFDDSDLLEHDVWAVAS